MRAGLYPCLYHHWSSIMKLKRPYVHGAVDNLATRMLAPLALPAHASSTVPTKTFPTHGAYSCSRLGQDQ